MAGAAAGDEKGSEGEAQKEKTTPAGTLWTAVTDTDGDFFWYNDALQASAWVLPDGATSTCGWQQDETGRWVNAATGAPPTLSPPLAVPAPLQTSAEVATPSLWKKVRSSDGGTVWWENVVTGKTKWKLPKGAKAVMVSRVSPEPAAALPVVQLPPSFDVWVYHQPPDQPAFWHHPPSGETAWTLPPGAETACGWTQEQQVDSVPLWRHLESGALRSSPPPVAETERDSLMTGARERSALYALGRSHGDEWVRAGDESGWKQPSTGAAASELPTWARTACGWWRQENMGVWLHLGSGATSVLPPSLKSKDAAALIRAHLCAMEAARSLL